jgi:hypothetical protein
MSGCTDEGIAYSSKHVKRKLVEHYGNHIYFGEVCGKKNVTGFRDMSNFIINEAWHKQQAQKMRFTKAKALLLLLHVYCQLKLKSGHVLLLPIQLWMTLQVTTSYHRFLGHL